MTTKPADECSHLSSDVARLWVLCELTTGSVTTSRTTKLFLTCGIIHLLDVSFSRILGCCWTWKFEQARVSGRMMATISRMYHFPRCLVAARPGSLDNQAFLDDDGIHLQGVSFSTMLDCQFFGYHHVPRVIPASLIYGSVCCSVLRNSSLYFPMVSWNYLRTDADSPPLPHSGPINTIAVHPTGKAFASGGEDGYVRVHWVSRE